MEVAPSVCTTWYFTMLCFTADNVLSCQIYKYWGGGVIHFLLYLEGREEISKLVRWSRRGEPLLTGLLARSPALYFYEHFWAKPNISQFKQRKAIEAIFFYIITTGVTSVTATQVWVWNYFLQDWGGTNMVATENCKKTLIVRTACWPLTYLCYPAALCCRPATRVCCVPRSSAAHNAEGWCWYCWESGLLRCSEPWIALLDEGFCPLQGDTLPPGTRRTCGQAG